MVVVAVTALVALSLVGVTLAMAGAYRSWLAVPVALLVTAAAFPLLRRLVDADASVGRTAQWCAIVAVALLTVVGAWSANRSSHHVVTNHDPGVYASTALLLAAEGSLRTTVGDPTTEPLVRAVLDERDDALVTAPGAYEVDAKHLEYQFSHSPSVVMAAAYEVAGRRGLFASPAAAGAVALLATYLLLTQLVRSAPLALAGTIALGVTTPFLYVTRGTYSEPFALAVISTGLALAATRRQTTPLRAAAVGLCIGASMLYRIDGQLAVVALIAMGAVAAFTGMTGRSLVAGAVAALVPVTIGLADLIWFSGDYWNAQESFDTFLRIAALMGLGAATFLFTIRDRPWAVRLRERWLPAAATTAALLTSVAFAALWLLRPVVQVARADWGADDPFALRVEQLQTTAGLAADGTRSYAELTVAAIGWYLGPAAMVLAVVGSGLLAYRAFRHVERPTARLVAFWLVAMPPFLLDWRITPYQPWASRRYIPIILPAIVICAVVATDAAAVGIRRWRSRDSRATSPALPGVAVGILAMLLVVPAVVAMAPVRNLAEQRGFLGGLDQGCKATEGGTVLSLGSSRFNVPLRAWCDVPTVAVPGVERETIEWFANHARATCEPAAILIADLIHLDILSAANADGLLDDPVVVDVTNPWLPEESIEDPPNQYTPERLAYAVATVRLPDGCDRPAA